MEFQEVVRRRRMVRNYDASRPVPTAVLVALPALVQLLDRGVPLGVELARFVAHRRPLWRVPTHSASGSVAPASASARAGCAGWPATGTPPSPLDRDAVGARDVVGLGWPGSHHDGRRVEAGR